jgi:hypothetical protein
MVYKLFRLALAAPGLSEKAQLRLAKVFWFFFSKKNILASITVVAEGKTLPSQTKRGSYKSAEIRIVRQRHGPGRTSP